jgi:hypothetical protein
MSLSHCDDALTWISLAYNRFTGYHISVCVLLVQYELLLCVEDESDPAVEVVRRLQDRHPTVSCRLFSGGKAGVLNPMVFNMAPAYENAAYDVVWVSTSRIKGKHREICLSLWFSRFTRVCLIDFCMGKSYATLVHISLGEEVQVID